MVIKLLYIEQIFGFFSVIYKVEFMNESKCSIGGSKSKIVRQLPEVNSMTS